MNKKNAFTLIEILVVIIILSFLASIAVLNYITTLENFKAKEAQHILKEIYGSQKRYYLDHDAYATQLSSLDIDIKDDSNFDPPIACDMLVEGERIIAYMDRGSTQYQYRIQINTDAEIICAPTAPEDICQKLGLSE